MDEKSVKDEFRGRYLQGNTVRAAGEALFPKAAKQIVKQVAVVVWEDITAYTRVEIPEDFEVFRLNKITVGMLWKESTDYIVLVQDYDISNKGKGFRHNDFHIIPRGAIQEVRILGEVALHQ